MPHQYKIDYDWNWAGFGGLKALRKKGFHEVIPRLAGGMEWTLEDLGVSRNPGLGAEGGHHPERKEGVLEKVVLPTGYSVFYRPGSGTNQRMPEFRKGRHSRHSVKELGVVDPVCQSHRVVEHEYTLVRQAVEMYLEKKMTGRKQSGKFRVGGQFENQNRLLDKLARTSPDLHDPQDAAEDDTAASEAEDNEVHTDVPPDGSCQPSQPDSKDSLLPVHQAPGADHSSQQSFLMEGRAIGDRRREGEETHRRGGGTPRAVPVREPTQLSPREAYRRAPLTVTKVTLSPRMEEKEEQEHQRGFDFIRKVNQTYSDSGPNREQLQQKIKLVLPYIFRHILPLEVVSARSSLTLKPNFKSRDLAGLTPQKKTRPDGEAPLKEKTPSPTFRPKKKSADRQDFWKPLLSQRGYNPFPPRPMLMEEKVEEIEQVEGHSLVTKMPSRVVLNIVLPREKKSREGRLCGRQVNVGKPLQAWLSASLLSQPPPPPPPSAPTGDGDGGLGDCVHEPRAKDVNTDDEDKDTSQSVGSNHPTKHRDHPHMSDTEASPRRPQLSTDKSDRDCDKPAKSPHAGPAKGGTVIKVTLPNTGTAADSSQPVAESESPKAPPPTPRPVDVDVSPPRQSVPVPHAGLEPQTHTVEPTLQESQPAKAPPRQRTLSSCRRATHCDLFGPVLCSDCEMALHRQQFTQQQDLLFPGINVSPTHMVAPQKFRDRKVVDPSRRTKVSLAPPRWPYTSVSQLKSVVTDLELCRRIVDRGHRAKFPSTL